MAAVAPDPQRPRPEHGGKRQRSVEMREKVPAARRLPFQRVAEPSRVGRDEQQIVHAGKMSRGGLRDLRLR